MDIIEGLMTRRSVYSFDSQTPNREDIETALAAAVLAPNHRRTKPWRFAVFADEARAELSRVMGLAAKRM